MWNLAAHKVAVPCVLNFDIGPPDCALRIQELDSFFISKARRSPGSPTGQYSLPFRIKLRQGFKSFQGLASENVLVIVFKVASNFKRTCSHESPLRKCNSRSEERRV